MVNRFRLFAFPITGAIVFGKSLVCDQIAVNIEVRKEETEVQKPTHTVASIDPKFHL